MRGWLSVASAGNLPTRLEKRRLRGSPHDYRVVTAGASLIACENHKLVAQGVGTGFQLTGIAPLRSAGAVVVFAPRDARKSSSAPIVKLDDPA